MLRQQGGDGEEAEGRCTGRFADELESVLEAPKGVWEFGIDQQDSH
jgi:hypothetical protein